MNKRVQNKKKSKKKNCEKISRQVVQKTEEANATYLQQ